MNQLQHTIEEAFERRADITPRSVEAKLKESITQVLEMLDNGRLRVAEKTDGEWKTNQWIKKAVLLSFRIEDNSFIKGGFSNYFDKVPSKFADYSSKDFRNGGFNQFFNGFNLGRAAYLANDSRNLQGFMRRR